MRRLDRTRAFGLVCPAGSAGGAFFFQDGLYFDAHDIAIGAPESDLGADAPAQPKPVEAAADVEPEELGEPETDWAEMSARPWFAFRAEVERRFGPVSSRKEAIALLREKGLLP